MPSFKVMFLDEDKHQAHVVGRLDLDNLKDLKNIKLPIPSADLILDFSAINQPSSFMLAWLLDLHRSWSESGYSLAIVNTSHEFRQLCQLYNMQHVIKVNG